MEQRGSEKKNWNWLLRPGLGLGDISIGDSISVWKDLLDLEEKGDFYNQMEEFLNEYELNKYNDESFKNEDFLFESRVFDIWIYTDSLLNITEIHTAEFCIFNDIDLIDSKIATIKNSFGVPFFFTNIAWALLSFTKKLECLRIFLKISVLTGSLFMRQKMNNLFVIKSGC